MIIETLDFIRGSLGLGKDANDLTFVELLLRGTIMFIAALVMVRVGHKRFMAQHAAFDVILALLLGSILSRGVNGSAPFFPTIGLGFFLVGLHQLLAVITFHWKAGSGLFKGRPDVLVRNGSVLEAALKRHHLTKHDLEEAMRMNGNTSELENVAEARLERNGDISIIKP